MNYIGTDIIAYKQYINSISIVLKKYFEHQKEYICCKKGCSYCCEKGTYPFTEIEIKYMLLGFLSLDNRKRNEIINNIKNLKKAYEVYKKKYNNQKFIHKCPFLDSNKMCSIYNYRGIICRTFGLITQLKNGDLTLPFCCDLGLNYSRVYDSKNEKFNFEKVKQLEYKNSPKAFKVSLYTLTSKDMFIEQPLIFGDIKPLIEWL